MTGAGPAEPRHRASRRAVTVALLRTVLSAGLLITGYYLAPLEGELDSLGWLWFLLALVLFVAVVVSDQPRLRAVEGLGVAPAPAATSRRSPAPRASSRPCRWSPRSSRSG